MNVISNYYCYCYLLLTLYFTVDLSIYIFFLFRYYILLFLLYGLRAGTILRNANLKISFAVFSIFRSSAIAYLPRARV